MARKSVAISVQTRLANGTTSFGALAQPADPVNAAGTAADSTALTAAAATVTANVATLVSDGASPTQAHVNTLNTNYTTLASAITTLQADIAAVPANADVVISYNASTVISKNTLRQALSALLQPLPETL